MLQASFRVCGPAEPRQDSLKDLIDRLFFLFVVSGPPLKPVLSMREHALRMLLRSSPGAALLARYGHTAPLPQIGGFSCVVGFQSFTLIDA